MPPKVDFYVLDRHVNAGTMRAACRLCKRIHALGHRIYVQTPDSEQAKQLDELMWTFDQGAFVPHEIYDPARGAGETPIAIGSQPPAAGGYSVLVSMLETVPDHYAEFARVAELVDNTEEDKARARDRYRWYRQRGCELDKHDISV